MRRLSFIALGVFLTSLVLTALTPHCVAEVGHGNTHAALAALPSHASDAGHHPGEHQKNEPCAWASDLTVANPAATRALPTPKLKMLAVLWPMPLGGGIAPLTTGSRPFSGVTARASPVYSSGFSRTDRLLI